MVGNLDPGESEGESHRILELLRGAIRTKCIEVFKGVMMIFRKVRYGAAGTLSVLLRADDVGPPVEGGGRSRLAYGSWGVMHNVEALVKHGRSFLEGRWVVRRSLDRLLRPLLRTNAFALSRLVIPKSERI